MIIMSRPNAPIGNLTSREVVEELCETDCIVVVDEAYAGIFGTDHQRSGPKYQNFIISRTFSKAMGLGGIRLGFMLQQIRRVIGYINRIRVPENVGVLTQVAALAALEDADYIRANTQRVIKSREWFQDEVAKVPGITVL